MKSVAASLIPSLSVVLLYFFFTSTPSSASYHLYREHFQREARGPHGWCRIQDVFCILTLLGFGWTWRKAGMYVIIFEK